MRTLPGNTSQLWLSWLQWSLLLAAFCFWYLAVSLLDANQQRDQAATLAADLAHYQSRSSRISPQQLLVDMRTVQPLLLHSAPDATNKLRQDIAALEAVLSEAQSESRLRGNLLGNLQDTQLIVSSRAVALRSEARSLLWMTLLSLSALILLALGAWRTARVSSLQSSDGGLDATSLQRLLFENMPGAVVVSDADDRIVEVNPAYSRRTGYAEGEVVGQALTFNHSGQQDEAFFQSMRDSLADTGCWDGEFWLRNKSGEAFADKVTRLQIRERGHVLGYLTLSMDVVGNDDAKRLMLWQAHHDTLTKLPTRNLFQERLSRVLLRAREDDFLGALISIDLDRFKMVNDSVGPSRGDQVLMDAAYRIAMCVSESDTVARLGGDHFVV